MLTRYRLNSAGTYNGIYHSDAHIAEHPSGEYVNYEEVKQTIEAQAARVRELEAKIPCNILRHVSSEWQTTKNTDEVTCHSRMVEGVLCRWWGDGETPKGVQIIDKAVTLEAELARVKGAV